MSKIKTTHVGSLPRSNELSELLFKKDQKEKIDFNQFDKIVKKDVNNIVKKQIEVGIDYISDGEMSKISYATYVKDRIDGFSGESERKAPKDLDDFPSFKERIARTGGTPTYTRPCCTSELKIKDKTSLTKDINNFKQALEKNNHKDFLKCYEIFVNYIDDDSIFKKIKVNTLITTGENDVGSTPEMSRNLNKIIHGSKFIEIKKGKHLCSIECADDVNITFKKFIDQHND